MSEPPLSDPSEGSSAPRRRGADPDSRSPMAGSDGSSSDAPGSAASSPAASSPAASSPAASSSHGPHRSSRPAPSPRAAASGTPGDGPPGGPPGEGSRGEPEPLHLTAEAADRLLAGLASAEERELGLRHLLARCSRCRERVHRGARERFPEGRRHPLEAYREPVTRALDRALQRVDPEALALESVAAPGLLGMLIDGRSIEHQRVLIRGDRRFQTLGLAERLMEESRRSIWSAHPDQVLELAQAGLVVAECLDPARYGRRLVVDLQARAHMCLGNAHRSRAEFNEAVLEFQQARTLLDQGTGDPLELAQLVSFEASLLIDRGYLEEAGRLMDRVSEVYGDLGDPQLGARALVKKSIAVGLGGDEIRAVELLVEAEARVDRAEDPRLFFCARHNRIWFLASAGEVRQALMLYAESRSVYEAFPDSWSQLRKRWLEARIAFGMGKLEEAEAALGQLWTTAFTRGLRLEVALISLDLSAVYVRLGKTVKAWRLAGRLVPLFKSWGVHRRALEAWALLQHSLSAQTANLELIYRISAYLQRGWRNPEIPFLRPSAGERGFNGPIGRVD